MLECRDLRVADWRVEHFKVIEGAELIVAMSSRGISGNAVELGGPDAKNVAGGGCVTSDAIARAWILPRLSTVVGEVREDSHSIRVGRC